MDIEGLEWAEVVVANMDGPDPDSGTCWECGYAYRKKPVVLYRTDFRAAGDTESGFYNLMLSESADARIDLPFAKIGDVANAIHEAVTQQYEVSSLGGTTRRKA